MLLPHLLLIAAGTAHPESLSRTRIEVAGARARVELRFQALSLLEVLPELEEVRDKDGNRFLVLDSNAVLRSVRSRCVALDSFRAERRWYGRSRLSTECISDAIRHVRPVTISAGTALRGNPG